jgi:pilus assembly protein CpaE
MKVFLVSDSAPTAQRVRGIVLRAGHECPAGNVLPFGHTATQLAGERPELVVVILSPDVDKSLAAVEQLKPLASCRILVVGSTADSRLVLRALRAGAADFVDEADLEADLTAVLERLQGGLGRQAEPARTIAVLAPSGGSGASTVAANVATVLAGQHKSTLLVDLKLYNGDLAALLDLRPAHTLAELCQNVDQLDRTMFERSLARHDSGVQLLAPPRWIPDAGYVTADGVRQVISLARTLFPYVVMDLDNSFAPEQVQALRQADVVLLVLRLDFASLRNAQRTLEYLGKLGVGRDKVRVVVNRYGQPKEVPAARAVEALGVAIDFYVPEDSKTVNRANNNGIPVVTESPSARVSRSLTNLAVSVNGRHTH